MGVFFWVRGGMNQSVGQTYRVNGEVVLRQFVPCFDSFPMEPRKKTFILYIYNASNKDPFLNTEKSY